MSIGFIRFVKYINLTTKEEFTHLRLKELFNRFSDNFYPLNNSIFYAVIIKT
jgi:hypothetical protein